MTNYLVTFERDPVIIQGGEVFPVSVFIQPAPPPGLYSFGVSIRAEGTNAVFRGVGDVQVSPGLSFDGPRAVTPVVAVGAQSAAAKGTTVFYTPSAQPSSNALLATFYIQDLSPGPYRLTLGFFNTLGTTEHIFTDGAGDVLDPWISFGSATVVRSGALSVENLGVITLNRQTGLFEQTVRIANKTLAAISAFRLLVTNLPPAWTVWNAHGQTNGLPFFQCDTALAPGGFLDLRVEYRIPNRDPSPQPGYLVEPTNPAGTPPGPSPDGLDLVPRATLADGSFLLEFSSLTNRFYAIHYSPDLTNWQTIVPLVRGNGSRVQWIDYGPPKTVRPPTSEPQRYYRVTLLPE